MLVDNWLILALIMIFSSILLCGFLPMIVRLSIARRRYYRYLLDLQAIEYSSPDTYGSQAVAVATRSNTREYTAVYSQLPFIDEQTRDGDTSV